MIDRVVGGVEAALRTLRPCRLSCGEAPVQVGFNRRLDGADGVARMAPNPAGPVDTAVRVVGVTDTGTGKLRAVLF